MTTKKQMELDAQDDARKHLLSVLKPYQDVYTNVHHVSQSGMSRDISVHIVEDGSISDISYHVAILCDYPMGKKGGIRVGGCGMDMGFSVVYDLSSRLFPDGFGIEGIYPPNSEDKCTPKTKEHAEHLVKVGAIFCGRNGDKSGWDNSGGYALKQRWM